MKSDLYAAINQIAAERNIPREAILRGIEDAIITAYRRIAGTDQNKSALRQTLLLCFDSGVLGSIDWRRL